MAIIKSSFCLWWPFPPFDNIKWIKNSWIDIAPNEGDFAKTAKAWWNWKFSGIHAKCRQMLAAVSFCLILRKESWGRTTISFIQVFNQWLISLYTASSVKNKSHRGFSEKCVCKRVSKNSYSVVHRVLVGLSLEKSRELPFIKFVWTNLRCITLHRSRWEVLSLLGRRQLLEQEVQGSLCLWPGHPSSPTTNSPSMSCRDNLMLLVKNIWHSFLSSFCL